MTNLLEIPIYVCEPRDDRSKVGVIRDINPNIIMPQLREQLTCNATVGQIRRLGASRTVRITYSSPTSSNYILVGCVRYRVEAFPHR